MSFVSFEKLPNILKKAIYEKSKFAYFVRKQPENEILCTQPISEILFDLESKRHEKLYT